MYFFFFISILIDVHVHNSRPSSAARLASIWSTYLTTYTKANRMAHLNMLIMIKWMWKHNIYRIFILFFLFHLLFFWLAWCVVWCLLLCFRAHGKADVKSVVVVVVILFIQTLTHTYTEQLYSTFSALLLF